MRPVAFLKSLLRPPVDWTAQFPGPPKVAMLPAPVGGENAIHSVLDRLGFPWRESSEALIARYGLVHDRAFGGESCQILPDPMQVEGLIRPFASPSWMLREPHLVPSSFSAYLWKGKDPAANIRLAHDQLARHFGPAQIGVGNNTVGCFWHAGPARIDAVIFPPELQTYPLQNDAYRRDPRLVTACHITIHPGYRPPMNDEEREWLRGFRPIAKPVGMNPVSSLEELWAAGGFSYNRAVLRQPPPDQDDFLGKIGLSADGEALIVCIRDLVIVPMERLTGLRLYKQYPAKGAGGVELVVLYDTGHGESGVPLSRMIRDMDGLDAMAERLARLLELPLDVPEPQYDC